MRAQSISNHTQPFYEDFWDENILHYTGMGQEEDQDIEWMQNKTLNHSPQTNIPIYLFEVHEPNKYLFQGQVKLIDKPYQKLQRDFKGNTRKAWMFPLKVVGNEPILVTENTVLTNLNRREKQLRKYTAKELYEKTKRIEPTRARAVPQKPVQLSRG